jgi:hypothetical protein
VGSNLTPSAGQKHFPSPASPPSMGCWSKNWSKGHERQREARGEGRWQVRISFGRDPASGRYRTIAREVRARKRDAELLAAKLVAEVERGAYRDREVSSRGGAGVLEHWIAHVET